MKTALLIIDVQKDYFSNGKMELSDSLKASLNIKDLIEHFRKLKMPIIYIQHISMRQGATFLLPNTQGSEFHENVKPIDGEKIFVKNFPNSFRNTKLNDYLRENDISTLIIVGMMTHMCVDTTVRAAFDFGYENIVVSDCCATKSLNIFDKEILAEDVQNAFLASLNGIFSKVLKKDDVIKLLES